MAAQLDPSKLSAFGDAAAGHQGVLSDPSGDVVVKPCTAAEVAFYESANASCPALVHFMPAFMGTLRIGPPSIPNLPSASGTTLPCTNGSNSIPGVTNLKMLNLPITHPPSTSIPFESAENVAFNDSGLLKGKRLETDLHIVLENVAAGFKQPNVMDLKLGSRLWADDAKPEKRARLDKVSEETTSGSLGFRIAGMRVWQGDKATNDAMKNDNCSVDENSNFKVYNKFYGRTFNADTVVNGLREYLYVPSAGVDKDMSLTVTQLFISEIEELHRLLLNQEIRMYSSSILLVYEGDASAWKEAIEVAMNQPASEHNEDTDAEEGMDENEDVGEVMKAKPYAVKLIDFAHASWTPGSGPDRNILQGIESTLEILEKLLAEFSV